MNSRDRTVIGGPKPQLDQDPNKCGYTFALCWTHKPTLTDQVTQIQMFSEGAT